MIVRYVVLLVLLAHGISHMAGFLATWTDAPLGFNAPISRAFGLLWLVALVAFLGAAFGLLQRRAWWRGLAINAAAISLIAIIPAWFSVTPVVRFPAVLIDLVIFVALIPRWGDRVSAELMRFY
jgi:hypothetical protein